MAATVTPSAPWHELAAGTVVTGPAVEVSESLVATLVDLGGYVHPLFHDDTYRRTHSPLSAAPLPGSAVLHLLGGLAEQCGALDDTALVLLGFQEVRFVSPLLAGDTLTLELKVLDTRPTSSGRAVLQMQWRGLRGTDVVVTALASMLVQPPR